MNLPQRLREVGIARDSIELIASHAMNDWTLSQVPRPVKQIDLIQILNDVW
jgi:alcohol dehydrogenase class IV